MALLSKDRDTDRTGARNEPSANGDLSVISKGMRVEGDIRSSGRVRIDGSVSGSVSARSVELTSSGAVDGDILAVSAEGAEAFVIDGTVKGTVRAPVIEIGEKGAVLSGVETDHATVRGRIQGGIRARTRLALTATAVVEGDIDARRLALQEGGQVNGNIRIGDRAALEEKGAGSLEVKPRSMPKASPELKVSQARQTA